MKQTTSAPSNEVTETTLDDPSDISNDKELNNPSDFALNQNYPNPFNPTTTINYQLPKASQVKINIYNLHGQLVASLINKYQKAGYYKLNWEAKNLVSGIYFYQLEAENFREIKKMTLLK